MSCQRLGPKEAFSPPEKVQVVKGALVTGVCGLSRMHTRLPAGHQQQSLHPQRSEAAAAGMWVREGLRDPAS